MCVSVTKSFVPPVTSMQIALPSLSVEKSLLPETSHPVLIWLNPAIDCRCPGAAGFALGKEIPLGTKVNCF